MAKNQVTSYKSYTRFAYSYTFNFPVAKIGLTSLGCKSSIVYSLESILSVAK